MIDAKRHCKFVERDDRRITTASLKAADVLLAEARDVGELLLREALFLPEPPNVSTDQPAHIHAQQASGLLTSRSPIHEEVAKRFWPSHHRPSAGTCSVGLLRGAIIKGDYERMVSFFKANHPFLGQFSLISPGGSVEEAIELDAYSGNT